MLRFAPVLVLLLGCADTEDKDPGSSTRSTAQAVTHGEPDTRHEATVRVALDRDTCSATFISSRVAVTAAHCLADGTPAAVLGADGSRVAVRAAVEMPGFDALTLERDLAVLILDAPIRPARGSRRRPSRAMPSRSWAMVGPRAMISASDYAAREGAS